MLSTSARARRHRAASCVPSAGSAAVSIDEAAARELRRAARPRRAGGPARCTRARACRSSGAGGASAIGAAAARRARRLVDQLRARHAREHLVAARLRGLGMVKRIEPARRLDQPGEQRGLRRDRARRHRDRSTRAPRRPCRTRPRRGTRSRDRSRGSRACVHRFSIARASSASRTLRRTLRSVPISARQEVARDLLRDRRRALDDAAGLVVRSTRRARSPGSRRRGARRTARPRRRAPPATSCGGMRVERRRACDARRPRRRETAARRGACRRRRAISEVCARLRAPRREIGHLGQIARPAPQRRSRRRSPATIGAAITSQITASTGSRHHQPPSRRLRDDDARRHGASPANSAIWCGGPSTRARAPSAADDRLGARAGHEHVARAGRSIQREQLRAAAPRNGHAKRARRRAASRSRRARGPTTSARRVRALAGVPGRRASRDRSSTRDRARAAPCRARDARSCRRAQRRLAHRAAQPATAMPQRASRVATSSPSSARVDDEHRRRRLRAARAPTRRARCAIVVGSVGNTWCGSPNGARDDDAHRTRGPRRASPRRPRVVRTGARVQHRARRASRRAAPPRRARAPTGSARAAACRA